jgi:hypothetical protein
MKELKDYTEEELRQELKRRVLERRKNTPRRIEYVEFEATVSRVINTWSNYQGREFKNPFILWTYLVKDCSSELADARPEKRYKLKSGVFNKGNAPKVGDRVRLRYRRTKGRFESVDLAKARITEIVNV